MTELMLPGCFTVTVAVAFAGGFEVPVAVAVYVVVSAGFTCCVPPVFAKGNDEPSVPVITTVVAFVAATVRVEEVPAAIVVGFAVMVTVGVGGGGGGVAVTVTVALAVAVPPPPVTVIVYVVV